MCRNIASNVKAVFEALKAGQSELSMLNNTYAVYGAGTDGTGYADSRANGFNTNMGDRSGHAWNTFVTVDTEGSAVATIIDATWALDTDLSSAIQHLDRTEVRAVAQLMELFEKSEVKSEAIIGLTDYTQKLITRSRRLSSSEHALREYVTTEYLKAAAQLTEFPEGFNLPPAITGSAYRLRGKLERKEIETLFALDKAGGELEQARLKAIITDYDSKRDIPLPAWQSAENLIFNDDELQALAFEAVGTERVARLSEQSGAFRARVRASRPGILPPFNASERPTDAQELRYFAARGGIHDKDPKMIMRQLHSRLRQAAGSAGVYDAIVTGRNDYEVAKNFSSILKALRSKPNV